MKLRFLMRLKETKLAAITMHGGANEGSIWPSIWPDFRLC